MNALIFLVAVGLQVFRVDYALMVHASPHHTYARMPEKVTVVEAPPDTGKGAALEKKGKTTEALRIDLSVPGGEYAAWRLAAKHPRMAAELLGEIRARGDGAALRSLLVLGDLAWTGGKNGEALETYRAFARAIAPEGDAKGWAQGAVPHDYCPVFREHKRGQSYSEVFKWKWCEEMRFDHWLLKRFIALDARDDAAAEFARIQSLYDALDGSPSSEALLFSLNHAMFLAKRGDEDAALRLLRDKLLKIDVDARQTKYALDAIHYSRYAPPSIGADEFIRLAFDAFQHAGKADHLVSALESSKTPAATRVLARVRLAQGDTAAFRRIELDYFDHARMPRKRRAFRKAKFLMDIKAYADAALEFENAYRLTRISHPFRYFVGMPLNYSSNEMEILEAAEECWNKADEPERALRIRLERIDCFPELGANLEETDQTRNAAEAIEKLDIFDDWTRKFLASGRGPLPTRANFLWYAGRRDDAVGALRRAARRKTKSKELPYFYHLDQWTRRFKKQNETARGRRVLDAFVEARPKDPACWLELAKFLGRDTPDDVFIALFETWLDSPDFDPARDDPSGFQKGWGMPALDLDNLSNIFGYNFHHGFEMARRLAKLYAKTGRTGKLKALVKRVLRLEAPFDSIKPNPPEQHDHRIIGHILNCFATQASRNDIEEIAALLEDPMWKSEAAFLEWVRSGGVNGDLRRFRKSRPAKTNADVPSFRILSSGAGAGVRTLATPRYIFAVRPWGIDVHTPDGRLLRNIFLDTDAVALAADTDALWIG